MTTTTLDRETLAAKDRLVILAHYDARPSMDDHLFDDEYGYPDDSNACPVCDGLHGLAFGCPLESTGRCEFGRPQMAPDGSGCLCGCC